MDEIIYSGSPIRDAGGRTVKNPLHFSAPEKGVKRVILNGDPALSPEFTTVESAYQREKGVKIERYAPGMFDSKAGGSTAKAEGEGRG